MTAFKEGIPDDFSDPICLPANPDQARSWQEASRLWWETNPMRYDWKETISSEEFTREFYDEIDERFLSSVREFMPWQEIPFDPLIDFESLRDKDVLEIGVGNGTHAGLLSQYARSYTGIDLTEYAVKSTSQRIRLLGRKASIMQMDAEHLQFADNSFDLIWSWGVIHHSSNTAKILKEIHRVLRPAGQAITMVYYRSLWSYYVVNVLFRGILQGQLLKTRSLHKINQLQTDGAIARFYSRHDWNVGVSDLFDIERLLVYGTKAELIPLPAGKVKNLVTRLIPDGASRLLTNRCRLGTFLVSSLRKRD
ncbi:MAG TPA: class I SAM-dependent methyltransferase [Pyrinomonadaceae bacterium]|nr:class I SAM-dependent methyltransferase [Pyrinomonadaceae bacterium]